MTISQGHGGPQTRNFIIYCCCCCSIIARPTAAAVLAAVAAIIIIIIIIIPTQLKIENSVKPSTFSVDGRSKNRRSGNSVRPFLFLNGP